MVLRVMLFVLLSLGGLSTAAEAQQYRAQTTTILNMREGPGTQYRVILAIPGNTNVAVDGCNQGYVWCRVNYGGAQGWVSSRYLRDPGQNRPVSDVGAQLGVALLNFIIGQIPRPGQPQQPPGLPQIPQNQVCFYADVNYGGASFCETRGTQDNQVSGSWNDRISSIRVGQGSGGVTVCRDANYQGGCNFYQTNVPQVSNNDTISSYRVGQLGPGGPGPFPPPPPPPPQAGVVCFYQDWDFGGASLCRGAGDQNASLPSGWNDTISSIRVDPSVWVQVCSDFSYQGQCVSVGNNTSRLTGGANDTISSYRIFNR